MAKIMPFKSLHPSSGLEKEISCPLYDVIDVSSAKMILKKNENSFIKVDKPEIHASTDSLSESVYEKAEEYFKDMISKNILVEDEFGSLYIYRVSTYNHCQTGIVCTTHIDDYLNGNIKKHENTITSKENDRAELIKNCSAHLSPVLMTYKDNESIDDIIDTETTKEPLYTFSADDGTEHTVWKINNTEVIYSVCKKFESVESIYIADGHHRMAAAAKVYYELKSKGKANEESGKCLSVLFPSSQLKILGYHRILKDLNGYNTESFIEKVTENFYIMPYTKTGAFMPMMPNQFGMYINNRWYILTLSDEVESNILSDKLDTSILYNKILSPILNIGDVKTDERISFTAGSNAIRDIELNQMIGQSKVSFTLYPVSVEDIMEIADNNDVMPPKSTYFEPKIRSGLFVHRF